MVSMNTGSIADRVLERVPEVPAGAGQIGSGTAIQHIVEDVISDLQEYLGDSISFAHVPVKYQNVLINLGCAYTLANMTGVGVDFDMSLGEFSVSKGSSSRPESQQIAFYAGQANNALKNLSGKPIISSTTV